MRLSLTLSVIVSSLPLAAGSLSAQYFAPPRAPDMLNPGYYYQTQTGMIYGPNHVVRPCFPPFQGMVMGPAQYPYLNTWNVPGGYANSGWPQLTFGAPARPSPYAGPLNNPQGGNPAAGGNGYGNMPWYPPSYPQQGGVAGSPGRPVIPVPVYPLPVYPSYAGNPGMPNQQMAGQSPGQSPENAGGAKGDKSNVAFPSHLFSRSPRDFFMIETDPRASPYSYGPFSSSGRTGNDYP